MISFPVSPTLGLQYTQGDTTWEWDGVKWKIVRIPLNSIMVPKDNPAVGTVPTGTRASPPAGLVIGRIWLDTTDSNDHPTMRVALVAT